LYVTDFNLDTVFQLDINFTTCTPLVEPGFLRRPSGIAVDDVGNIIVCDSKNNSVKMFLPNGQLIGRLDRIGTSRMDLPLDVTLMKTGFLAILDFNGRVRII
jgi:DNA-binding beta-propeller fold protein YncE